eukprot:scaffold48758_cov61-Phaeocystis_antarctica.AAC.2
MAGKLKQLQPPLQHGGQAQAAAAAAAGAIDREIVGSTTRTCSATRLARYTVPRCWVPHNPDLSIYLQAKVSAATLTLPELDGLVDQFEARHTH